MNAFMACAMLAAPHRAAAASVAAELNMSAPDPVEWARQYAFQSTSYSQALPAVAEALLVLGHTESSLSFTGEMVRTCALRARAWSPPSAARTQ